MMKEVDGMRQEDYSKDWVMHNGKSNLILWLETGITKNRPHDRTTYHTCGMLDCGHKGTKSNVKVKSKDWP